MGFLYSVFFSVLAVYLVLCYFRRKYRNPYTLTFVFGKKGAGKSCYMVKMMLRYLRKGWHVYTDMKDIRIPGVRIIPTKALETFRPEEGSAIFLDEVGISMDNRDFKSFPPGLRDFFKYIRKMRCCVYMNSQAFDVDKKVRDTTDRMVLQIALFDCISLSRPIKRTVTLTESTSQADSRIADELSFCGVLSWRLFWMPAYFKYFDSFEMPKRPLMMFQLPEHPMELLPWPRRILAYGREVVGHVSAKVRSYIHFS